MWKDAVELFRNYMGTGLIVIWFLMALIYLLVNEKRKFVRILFVYMPVTLLLLYFNPLFAKLFFEVLDAEIYYRLLWLLPITPVIAYVYVCLCVRVRESRGKWAAGAAALGMAVLIAFSGSFIYNNQFFYKAENQYHMPESVVHICDAIIVPGREVMAAFPPEFVQFVRQYSPLVCMPYGRETIVERWGFESEIYDLITAEEIDLEALNRAVLEQRCHYVILHSSRRVKGDFADYKWELFCETDGYCVYRTEYPLITEW